MTTERLDGAALVIIVSGLGMELANAFMGGVLSSALPRSYLCVWVGLFIVLALRVVNKGESVPRSARSSLMGLDLLALLSVVPFGFGINILILSMFRLFGVVSSFDKDGLGRTNIFATAIQEQKAELLVTLAISGIALLIVASMFFMIEAPYQGQSANIYTFFKWSFGVLLGKDVFVSLEPQTGLGFLLYLAMIIIGIAVVSLPISILSGGFATAIARSTAMKRTLANRVLLQHGFETLRTIPERGLVKRSGLVAKRKSMTMDFALTRLGLTLDEVSEVVRSTEGVRLRSVPKGAESAYDDALVIESYEANASYGTCEKRSGSAHVISTQSAGDAFIGHFAATLAASLDASYFSNEYFSSGDPIPAKRCNFAKNDAYLKSSPEDFRELVEFVDDLSAHVKTGDLVLYIGTCRENAKHLYLLAGGKANEPFENIENPTVGDIARLYRFGEELAGELQDLQFQVGVHEEYGTGNPAHLSHFVHDKLAADCLIIYVNVGLLRHAPYTEYFGAIVAIISALHSVYPEKFAVSGTA